MVIWETRCTSKVERNITEVCSYLLGSFLITILASSSDVCSSSKTGAAEPIGDTLARKQVM